MPFHGSARRQAWSTPTEKAHKSHLDKRLLLGLGGLRRCGWARSHPGAAVLLLVHHGLVVVLRVVLLLLLMMLLMTCRREGTKTDQAGTRLRHKYCCDKA